MRQADDIVKDINVDFQQGRITHYQFQDLMCKITTMELLMDIRNILVKVVSDEEKEK